MTVLGFLAVGVFTVTVIKEGITGGLKTLGKWQKKSYKYKYEKKYYKKELKRQQQLGA